jgi:hypothetical protein
MFEFFVVTSNPVSFCPSSFSSLFFWRFLGEAKFRRFKEGCRDRCKLIRSLQPSLQSWWMRDASHYEKVTSIGNEVGHSGVISSLWKHARKERGRSSILKNFRPGYFVLSRSTSVFSIFFQKIKLWGPKLQTPSSMYLSLRVFLNVYLTLRNHWTRLLSSLEPFHYFCCFLRRPIVSFPSKIHYLLSSATTCPTFSRLRFDPSVPPQSHLLPRYSLRLKGIWKKPNSATWCTVSLCSTQEE